MRRISLPSPAMAVALLALVVALGGTATGAPARLSALVSGSKLKNHSVSGKKLKANTLTGREVSESKLKRVPRANFARTAGVALSAGNATTVGGVAVRRISFRPPSGFDDTVILDLAGLQLVASCPGGKARLIARSTVNDADLRAVVGTDRAVTTPHTGNLDIGNALSLSQGKAYGSGSLVYNRRDPASVTVTFDFASAPSLGGFAGCTFGGTAIGG